MTLLDLGCTQITDRGLVELQVHENITSLLLFNTAVTDAGLAELAKFRHLNRLDPRRTRATAAGLGKLRKSLPGLSVIADRDVRGAYVR